MKKLNFDDVPVNIPFKYEFDKDNKWWQIKPSQHLGRDIRIIQFIKKNNSIDEVSIYVPNLELRKVSCYLED